MVAEIEAPHSKAPKSDQAALQQFRAVTIAHPHLLSARERLMAILSDAPRTDMPIHDRQPVVLDGAWDQWLDPGSPTGPSSNRSCGRRRRARSSTIRWIERWGMSGMTAQSWWTRWPCHSRFPSDPDRYQPVRR